MGDVLIGEFENTAKCEHRICPDKCKMGQAQTLITTERDNKSALIRNVISFSVGLMKSLQATMKSSLRSDEIHGQALG